jgi:hypothetical protein
VKVYWTQLVHDGSRGRLLWMQCRTSTFHKIRKYLDQPRNYQFFKKDPASQHSFVQSNIFSIYFQLYVLKILSVNQHLFHKNMFLTYTRANRKVFAPIFFQPQ